MTLGNVTKLVEYVWLYGLGNFTSNLEFQSNYNFDDNEIEDDNTVKGLPKKFVLVHCDISLQLLNCFDAQENA